MKNNLTEEDWAEIYYAVDLKRHRVLEGQYSSEVNEEFTIKWAAQLLKIMEIIGPDGENMFSKGKGMARRSGAVPDLLEACKQIISRLDHHGSVDQIREEGPIEDLRNAISKAEGKERK